MSLMGSPASPPAEDLDPATGAASAAEGAVVASDANPAASSPVDPADANEPRGLLDVVKSAVEPAPVAEASSTPEGDPANAEAEGEADKGEPKAEDEANPPFHEHPRWKELVSERDGLRETADRWNALEEWRTGHNLSVAEVAEGYEIMALLKGGDHDSLSKARDWFAERLDALDGVLGITLPDDLRQRVDEGLLDEEGAKEIARARAAVNLNAEQSAARTAQAEQTRQAEEAATVTKAMVDAVNGWEERTKAVDPDYAKKANLIQDRCQRIVSQEGNPPRTAEEATALADRAHREITAEMKAALPKPRPISPSPVGRSTTQAAPAPKTLRDAVNAAIGR